jgi:hypothetical protein
MVSIGSCSDTGASRPSSAKAASRSSAGVPEIERAEIGA